MRKSSIMIVIFILVIVVSIAIGCVVIVRVQEDYRERFIEEQKVFIIEQEEWKKLEEQQLEEQQLEKEKQEQLRIEAERLEVLEQEQLLLSQQEELANRTIRMSFLGDCIIASAEGIVSEPNFNWYAKNYEATYFLEHVRHILEEDDITIANCENVLSDQDLEPRDKGHEIMYWFRGPTKNSEIFSSSSVEVVGIANNHIYDYAEQGRSDTIAALKNAGVTPALDGVAVYQEVGDYTVGILAMQVWVEGQEKNYEKVIKEMVENSDVQIAYLHGGEEGLREPEQFRVDSFRSLIDSGIDAVVAMHAHVLQPIEIYQNKLIAYGLGNFTYGGHNAPENRTVILQADFTIQEDGSVTIMEWVIPCYVWTGTRNNWQPAIIEDEEEKLRVIDFMYGNASTPF